MIEGMEILKKTEIVTEKALNIFDFLPHLLLMGGGLLIFLFALFFFADKVISEKNIYGFAISKGPKIAIGIGGFFFLASAILPFIFIKPVPTKVPTGRYEYEATLDDTVNLKEVCERYEVVETKGDIYVLRDKEE